MQINMSEISRRKQIMLSRDILCLRCFSKLLAVFTITGQNRISFGEVFGTLSNIYDGAFLRK